MSYYRNWVSTNCYNIKNTKAETDKMLYYRNWVSTNCYNTKKNGTPKVVTVTILKMEHLGYALQKLIYIQNM